MHCAFVSGLGEPTHRGTVYRVLDVDTCILTYDVPEAVPRIVELGHLWS